MMKAHALENVTSSNSKFLVNLGLVLELKLVQTILYEGGRHVPITG